MKPLSTPRLILSSVLIIIGVIVLVDAESFWVHGERRHSEIMALASMAPLIWGIWLRRKKPEGRV